jgi:hypothetical protein
MARMLDERGFTSKGVDMSCTAVTLRLQSMAALSTMCLRLGKATITSTVATSRSVRRED